MAELTMRARSGDAAAFEALVLANERLLYGLARSRCGDAEAARDVVQEALLSAWQNLATLKDPGAFRSWLLTILEYKCSEWRRRLGRGPTLPKLGEPAAPESDHAADERAQRLASAIGLLDGQKQRMLALRYAERMGYAEIAQALGLTEIQVRGQLFRAREELRRQVRRDSE